MSAQVGWWRVGNSWGSKPGAAFVTIIQNGQGPLDDDSRRADDRLIAVATPEDARLICDAVNAYDPEEWT